MAHGSFPPTGSFAVTRPRTLREYRQAIFAGLKDFSNEDLVLLLALHFPEIHHVQDAQKNLINILLARLPVSEIWTRVNAFLVLHKELPLEGEAPPTDLMNRSSRVVMAEPASASSPFAAESMWSSDEITLPGALAQPAPRGTTATIPVPGFAPEPISQPMVPTPPAIAAAAAVAPAVRQPAWPVFGGLLLTVALIGVHVCPYVKHGVSPTKPERLVSLDTAPVVTSALPRFTVIPAPALESSERPHSRHHRSLAAGQSYDLTSEPECRFTRTRVVHGQLKDKVVKKKLPLPHGLKPGSSEAKDWLQRACEKVQQDLPSRR